MVETTLEISKSQSEILELYNRIKPTENIQTVEKDGKRYYITPNGTYISVTSFLGHFKSKTLIEWNKKPENQEKKKKILESGTNMHGHIENFLLKGVIPKVVPTDRGNKLFHQILPELQTKFGEVLCEIPLWSDYLQLAGRADTIGFYDGVLSVVDYKSSERIKKLEWMTDYFLQATCYALMFEERTGHPVSQLVLLISTDQGMQKIIRPVDDYLLLLHERLTQFRTDKGGLHEFAEV